MALAVVLAVVLAGCGAPASPTATPTQVPMPAVTIVGDGPAFEPVAATDYRYVLAGAGLVAGDEEHAWVVAFGEAQGDQEVMRLLSVGGGAGWEIADRRVGRSIGLAFDPPGPIPATVLPSEDGGEWTMYFAASPAGGDDGADIWRATAPAPEGPWTADAEPVLARSDVPTETGGDPMQVDLPAVVRTDDGYRMLFGWSPTRATTRIRSATSDDGVTWTVDPAVAIDIGHCGGFDDRSVAMPRLLAHPDGGWIALYSGYGDLADPGMAVGLSRSVDGSAWTCAAPEPVVTAADVTGSEGLHSYALLGGDGAALRLLIESLREGGSDLWLAELSLSP